MTHVLLQIVLHLLGTRSHRVARVQHLDHHITAVQHLVQLVVDALALARRQEDVLRHQHAILVAQRGLVRQLLLVHLLLLLHVRHQIGEIRVLQLHSTP